MKNASIGIDKTDPLYIQAEANANRFNMICLALLAALSSLVVVCNEFGVFNIERKIVLYSIIPTFICFLLPLVIYLVNDKILKREHSVIEYRNFKIMLIAFAYFGIVLVCIALSFHAVLLMAVPALISAQYAQSKKVFVVTIILTMILVPASTYGSFFFGAPDRNFIKGMLTDEEAKLFANRVRIATASRMIDIFTHYVLPRLISIIAIVTLVYGITRRNGRLLTMQKELSQQVNDEMERMNAMQGRVIDVLATLIETRDVGTGEHVIRTSKYVGMLAHELQKEEKYKDMLSDDEIRKLQSAAPLHDVGKIAVSDTILLKPGKLTAEEFEIMKTHTVKGRKMIESIFSGIENSELLRTAEDIAVSHHERWDGAGYPNGLKGEEIPLSARIMAVADVFDALVSVRVYKKP
ncbi:MAG: HD domain-containing protein, partial [Clostridia bacterium]|nr:HD domain-containing protein [Clostridia bacterium]